MFRKPAANSSAAFLIEGNEVNTGTLSVLCTACAQTVCEPYSFVFVVATVMKAELSVGYL
jgi:hypothetical protein